MKEPEIDSLVYTTKKSIIDWQNNIEGLTGLKCVKLSDLPKNSSLVDMREALILDRCWFSGLADEILTNI